MTDWRYHIASLSAVLLALAIGLLLGALYLSPTVPMRLERSLKRLDEHLRYRLEESARLKAEVETLRNALARDQSIYEELRERLPEDYLRGTRVALIKTGDREEVLETVLPVLQKVGAQIVSITTLNWREVEEGKSSLIVHNLATILTHSGGRAEEQLLRKRKGVRLRGDYNTPVTHVVLIGGFQKEAQEESIPPKVFEGERALIEALQGTGLKLIGCEPFDSQFSSIETYRLYHLPTVDCIDTATGQFILPFLFQEEEGNYGLKPSADAVLPARALEFLGEVRSRK